MKTLALSLGLFVSFASFAQGNLSGQFQSGQPVCESVQRNTTNSNLVTQCLQVIRNNSYDRNIVALLSRVAVSDRAETLASLQISSNQEFDVGAVQVCEAVRANTTNMALVTDCLRSIVNKFYAPELSELAARVAKSDRAETNMIMKNSMGAYFQIEGLAVCETVRRNTTNMALVTRCVSTIANKIFLDGSESMCDRIAVSDRASAITCLANAAVPYVPARDLAIQVMASELRTIKRNLLKARSMIEKGMTDNALRTLDDTVRSVETIEARQ